MPKPTYEELEFEIKLLWYLIEFYRRGLPGVKKRVEEQRDEEIVPEIKEFLYEHLGLLV